jgi:hypothetical protein
MHADGAPMEVLRKTQRAEVVDHRRAKPGALRREHPIAEVHDVEAAEEAFGDRPSERSPNAARRVRRDHHDESPVDAQPLERLVHELAPANADGSEGDDVVLRAALSDHALQGPEDVVADARPRVRQGRHVIGDSHGAL